MVKHLIRNIATKITIFTFTGCLLLHSGCFTYKTISSDSIFPVKSIERSIKRLPQSPINYDALTWQEAIEYVQTPEQAQDYLDNHFTEQDESKYFLWIPGIILIGSQKGETFKYNHSFKKGNCFDYATSAAALLSDNGYPPLLLDMRSSEKGHTVFLYRTEVGFGVLGNSPLKPVYPTVDDIVAVLQDKYEVEFEKYSIINLDDNFSHKKWISGDMNLCTKMMN